MAKYIITNELRYQYIVNTSKKIKDMERDISSFEKYPDMTNYVMSLKLQLIELKKELSDEINTTKLINGENQ